MSDLLKTDRGEGYYSLYKGLLTTVRAASTVPGSVTVQQ